MNEPDYGGDMFFFQNQLASHGITQEMFDMDRFAGCTFTELQNIVNAVIRKTGK